MTANQSQLPSLRRALVLLAASLAVAACSSKGPAPAGPHFPSEFGMTPDVPELTPWTAPKPAPVPAGAAATATPAAPPTPLPAAASSALPSAAVARLLSSMTVEEKVGQLVTVSARAEFFADDDPRFLDLVRLVEEEKVGGICWFHSDVLELATLNARLQARAKIPLLVSADLESGPGMRVDGLTWGPWAMAVAATGDPALAERRGRETAEQARAIGVHHVYAPVADVNDDPDNPVINTRSYGEDPAEVGRYVAATVKGIQAGGALATLKHFPGHGSTSVDSHLSLPVLAADRQRLDRVELVPFRAGLAAGAASVMVAHLAVPALDATPVFPLERPAPAGEEAPPAPPTEPSTMPATLSRAVVEGLLRGTLKFGGIVVTDSMSMGGVTSFFEPGEAAVRAVDAGADVVLLSPDSGAAVASLAGAVRSGRISPSRLDASVRRILEAKERLGLFRAPAPSPERAFALAGTRAQRGTEEEIARRGLTLVAEAPGTLPLSRDTVLAHVVLLDDETFPGPEGPLNAELKKRLAIPPAVVRIPPSASDDAVEKAAAAASRADVVLLSFFVRARSGKGTIAVPDPARKVTAKVLASGKRVVAVSFGSPYVARDVPGLPTYIAAWGPQEVVQLAAARALFGEAIVEGKLPVSIPGVAARGTGLKREAR